MKATIETLKAQLEKQKAGGAAAGGKAGAMNTTVKKPDVKPADKGKK